MGEIPELALAIANLQLSHIDHVQLPVRAEPLGEILRKIAINAGGLQHAHAGVDLRQQRALQSLVIAEEDRRNDPRMVEPAQRMRIQVRPGVGLFEIRRHPCQGVGGLRVRAALERQLRHRAVRRG